MNNKDKKILIFYILINVLIFVTAFGFYFLFISQFDKVETNKIITTYQKAMEQGIHKTITNIQNDFEEITQNNEVEFLNDFIDNNFEYKKFIYFTEYQEDGFSYLEFDIELKDNIFTDYGFGFFDQYFYFFNDKMFGVAEIENVFNPTMEMTLGSNVILMSRRGQIFFHQNNSSSIKVLHEYISTDTSDLVNNRFSKAESFTIKTKIENENVSLNFASLSGFPDLYVGQVFPDGMLESRLFKYHVYYGITLGITILGNLILLGFIFRSYRVKNFKFRNLFKTRVKVDAYVMQVNSKGEIVMMNNRMKSVLEKRKFKHINDFDTTMELQPFEMVKQVLTTYLIIDDQEIRFIVLENKNNYYLLGD